MANGRKSLKIGKKQDFFNGSRKINIFRFEKPCFHLFI